MGWDKTPDLFAGLIEQEADRLYRGFALTCLNNVVYRSPVDSGRFRGSHILSIGSPDYTVTADCDKAGTMTLKTGMAKIKGIATGAFPPVFIQTNLPYARRLEYGWSKQAAEGVYAVSFNNAVQAYRS